MHGVHKHQIQESDRDSRESGKEYKGLKFYLECFIYFQKNNESNMVNCEDGSTDLYVYRYLLHYLICFLYSLQNFSILTKF